MSYIFASLASATAYGVADLAGGLAGRQKIGDAKTSIDPQVNFSILAFNML